jgi:hypothetical protein
MPPVDAAVGIAFSCFAPFLPSDDATTSGSVRLTEVAFDSQKTSTQETSLIEGVAASIHSASHSLDLHRGRLTSILRISWLLHE